MLDKVNYFYLRAVAEMGVFLKPEYLFFIIIEEKEERNCNLKM